MAHSVVAVSNTPNSQYDVAIAMRKPIHIAAPRPTLEERTKQLGVSKARQKELQVLVDEYKAQFLTLEEPLVTSIQLEKRRKRASAA